MVYAPVTAISTPTDTVAANPTSPLTLTDPATPVVVSFGSATCPAGQQLVGRSLYVNGQAQTPVNATTTTWTPTTAATYRLSYTIFCGESIESAQSPSVDYVVATPTTEPTPSATPTP